MRIPVSLFAAALAGVSIAGQPAAAEQARLRDNPQGSPDAAPEQPAIAAMAVLDAYLDAFNKRDDDAFEATFNFPTYRLAANQFVAQQPGQTDFTAFVTTKPNWSYSRWARRDVIHSGPDKVHIAARLARYRADGSLVESFDSLYVITRQDGHWGIKIRSSYAPN